MKLKDYLYFERISTAQLARDLDVSRGYLTLVVNGHKKPSKRLAKDIQLYTHGKVTIEDLLKD